MCPNGDKGSGYAELLYKVVLISVTKFCYTLFWTLFGFLSINGIFVIILSNFVFNYMVTVTKQLAFTLIVL